MSLFYPTFLKKKAYDIEPEFLQNAGVSGLILDIDNTLTSHDHPVPDARILAWLALMRQNGIQLILLSNNSAERVAPFAAKLGLAFEANAKKPLPGGYVRAAQKMGLPKNKTAVVGDQIFTDVLGANWAGIRSILVEPFHFESFWQFRLKRWLEKGILRRYRKKRGISS